MRECRWPNRALSTEGAEIAHVRANAASVAVDPQCCPYKHLIVDYPSRYARSNAFCTWGGRVAKCAPPHPRVLRGVGTRWRARAAKRAVAEEQTSVMARKLRVCCVASADLSEVGLNHPFLVGYVTEAASFAHAPRTRRRFGKFCLISSELCLRSQVSFA